MAGQLSIARKGSVYHDDFTILVGLAFDRALALQSEVSERVLELEGMSGRCYRMFINNLIRLVSKPRYLEIGSWSGSTACSAMDRNVVSALCIDNWSEYGGPKDAFFTNINATLNQDINFRFIESDFRAINVAELGQFNVYLFDGPHTLQDHYDALALYETALDDDVFFIVDDWNWGDVRAGTLQAISKTGFNIDFCIEVRTTQDNTQPAENRQRSDWHNGYFISKLSRKNCRFD
jgi:hypothetical protein